VSGERILVVDDDAAIRETFERNLTRWGYAVTVASSAEEALSRLKLFAPALIITDIRMSGMNGLELLRITRERAPDVDVIVITAFEDMATAIAAMRAGAFEYLVKPLDLDEIELTIQRCLRQRSLRDRVKQSAHDAGEPYALQRLIGRDPLMIDLYKTIGTVCQSRAPVLIRGETGTGKEVIARAIHFNSDAAEEPFVAVNCTALPDALLESELFGHVRGAFTGAVGDRKGRFALAGRGTILLDEIGDTAPGFQAKLLRVLQEREYQPVGADRVERTEARVIAATHRDLERLVRDGRFREDLYFRLRVVEIQVPPLRERRGDIPLLAQHLLDRAATTLHRPRVTLSSDAMAALSAHDWAGNVRELDNAITRSVALARGRVIERADLALVPRDDAPTLGDDPTVPTDDSLAAAEYAHVQRILRKAGGNKRQAARMLRISRARLDRLIEKHHPVDHGHAP
jgi:DNA-binding NtrC family response regulator